MDSATTEMTSRQITTALSNAMDMLEELLRDGSPAELDLIDTCWKAIAQLERETRHKETA